MLEIKHFVMLLNPQCKKDINITQRTLRGCLYGGSAIYQVYPPLLGSTRTNPTTTFFSP